MNKFKPVPIEDYHIPFVRITSEELLEFLREFYKENGRVPTTNDFTGSDIYPNFSMYRRRFGSWSNAIVNAGLVPNRYKNKKDDKCYTTGMNMLSVLEYDVKIRHNYFVEYKKIISAFGHVSYYENPDCVLYIKHIRDYLESILNVERLPYKGAKHRKKSVDFLMNWNGKKLKVKLVVSSMNNDSIGPFWNYSIQYNKEVDAFLLVSFGDREYLDLRHMWLIMSDQILEIIHNQPFRYRETLRIRDSKYIIDYMNKFELKEKFEQLKIIMKKGYHMPNDDHKDATRLLLIKKQNQIFNTTGVKKSIISIAEDAIERGLGPKEISVDNVVLKIKKRRLRIVEGERKGLLREECENDAYNLIIEKQKEIFDMTGNMRTIKDIIDAAIELGIEYVK